MTRHGVPADREPRDQNLIETLRRAFEEFLALPTVVIAIFGVLAIATWLLDERALRVHDPVREFLSNQMFGRTETTANLLGIVAAGLITVTSIIVSLLIVAIQASATAMSMAVFDQFLRRRLNQFYFGLFVGVALYSLLTLATTHQNFNPVYGGVVCILLSALSLYLLIILLYTTINQMRPQVVIAAIVAHAVRARSRQRDFICRTRPDTNGSGRAINSRNHGYVVAIDLDAIERALGHVPAAEVHLSVAIGTFVCQGDPVAQIRGTSTADLDAAVLRAVRLERQRDITIDAVYAIEQISNIGWTSISSAKSNPEPGLVAIRAMRQLLAEWSADQQALESERGRSSSRITYPDDPYGAPFDALESCGIAASESMQHQSLTEVVRSLVAVYDAIPESWRPRADDVVLRLMTTLADHVLSVPLETELRSLAIVLSAMQRRRAAAAVHAAIDGMRNALGEVSSRGERYAG